MALNADVSQKTPSVESNENEGYCLNLHLYVQSKPLRLCRQVQAKSQVFTSKSTADYYYAKAFELFAFKVADSIFNAKAK